MIKRAEEFAAKDEASRRKVGAINELATFVYDVKAQITDKESWGGKVRPQKPTFTLLLMFDVISSATETSR